MTVGTTKLTAIVADGQAGSNGATLVSSAPPARATGAGNNGVGPSPMAPTATWARRLGVTRKVLDIAVRAGALQAHKIGRYVMVSEAAVAAWLAATEIKP